ncbi:two-component system histidine kinase PnpS [Natribacillus halophilus]|uniref:histidine kinase n=1 Tax=Natribacillus halophilus TaxID=549003 RepID=A0A1G8RY54_9BACI|nr:ATP-binding protein [Natribacillus halophilus]SDJ21851.1 two-component system, OmpR family, phosphate regulon sensor histidine kinase PhoR [Natribacillus halophilus]
MNAFRSRLMVSLLVIILLTLVALGFLIGQLINNLYIDETVDRLQKEAQMIASFVEESDDDPQTLSEEIGMQLDLRITFLAENGEVIAESSDVDSDDMENHLGREEVQSAGNPEGATIRESETLGTSLLYYAHPMGEGDTNEGYVRLALPIDAVQDATSQMWMIITVGFLTALFVIVVLGYRVTRRLTRPIDDVTAMANELAKGNYRARTHDETSDELGQLTRSINTLAYNLQKTTSNYQRQQENLEALIDNMGSGLLFIDGRGRITLANRMCDDIFHTDTNEWLEDLYYERIHDHNFVQFIQRVFLTEAHAHEPLQFDDGWTVKHYEAYGTPVMNDKGQLHGVVIVLHDITGLKRLEEIRKDFVANVSHELKTPVTSLKGFAETLLSEPMDHHDLQRQFLEIIWKESDRLQDLVSDLLELSRIETHNFQLDLQPIDLAEIGAETKRLLRKKAGDKSIAFNVSNEGNTEMIGDAARIKQMLVNLLTNAIAYTPEDGEVELHIYEEDNFVACRISDTGIGIEEQDLPRIFERFYRVDRARSRDLGGTGLGLAIVKHLLEAHAGTIEAESEPNVGTTFTIRLPKDWNG